VPSVLSVVKLPRLCCFVLVYHLASPMAHCCDCEAIFETIEISTKIKLWTVFAFACQRRTRNCIWNTVSIRKQFPLRIHVIQGFVHKPTRICVTNRVFHMVMMCVRSSNMTKRKTNMLETMILRKQCVACSSSTTGEMSKFGGAVCFE